MIDPFSLVPLFVESYRAGKVLGSGTGFAVQKDGQNFLITNGHVITGRHPDTGKVLSNTAGTPTKIAIWHHIRQRLGTWGPRIVDLYNPDDSIRWHQHPTGLEIDVVALPFSIDDEVQVYPMNLGLATLDLIVSPSEPVSIIGFPFGLSPGGRFPIWKTGHIASDIDLDVDGHPKFLIDATTKSGMSGSLVIARRVGGYRSSQAAMVLGRRVANRFLGVYSGRIHDQSDVGMVWKPEVLDQIIPGHTKS